MEFQYVDQFLGIIPVQIDCLNYLLVYAEPMLDLEMFMLVFVSLLLVCFDQFQINSCFCFHRTIML